MKRRRLLVLLAVAAVAGASAAAWLAHHSTAPLAERPFTDLATALANDGPHGWELHIAPREAGPYRLLRDGSVLGGSPQTEMTCTVRDSSGAVLEEVKLKGDPAFDQVVKYLETPSGRKTMVVLRRPR